MQTKNVEDLKLWFRKKKEEQEMREKGLDPEKEKLLLVSAEDAEWLAKRKRKRKNEDAGALNCSDPHYHAYCRRMRTMNFDPQEYKKAKETQKDFYRDANNLNYSQAPTLPQKNVNRMVDELERSIAKRALFTRRRTFYDDADIDYINERNRVFNKKIARAFDKSTVEIRQNLERGTAI